MKGFRNVDMGDSSRFGVCYLRGQPATVWGMRIRGLVGVALIALLSGCAGAAVAAPEPVPTTPTADPVIDVEAIARDEIAALAALGYPADDLSFVSWEYVNGLTNDNGGTAFAMYPRNGLPTVIRLNSEVAAYGEYGGPEVGVRSTVRHEFGHAVVYAYGYSSDSEDEIAIRRNLCSDKPNVEPANTRWGHECIAEAISDVLSAERGEAPRFEFYGGTDLSDTSLSSARTLLAGVTTDRAARSH